MCNKLVNFCKNCGKENTIGFKLTYNISLPRGMEYYIFVGSRAQIVRVRADLRRLAIFWSRSCKPSVVTIC